MSKYQFIREGNTFIWGNGIIKLQFTNPSIQADDEYTLLKRERDILYYYYTVEIFKNVYIGYNKDEDKDVYEWKLVTKRSTYDFPTIEQLKWILNHAVKELNPTIHGEKYEYASKKVEFSKTLHTEGFACDDFYEVTKFVDCNNENPSYKLYIGCTFDCQGDLNSEGIRTPYVEESDIKELLKCVKAFIKYSMDVHNDGVKKYIKEQTSNKRINNGKIYEYDKDKLNKMFTVGDFGDFRILKNKDMTKASTLYRGVQIVEIKKDSIVFSNKKEVMINEVIHAFIDVSKEKLSYDVNQVASDFITLLDEEELKEFKEANSTTIMDKYKDVIVNRTWMCRDEHNFNDVNKAVEEVVNIIRNT